MPTTRGPMQPIHYFRCPTAVRAWTALPTNSSYAGAARPLGCPFPNTLTPSPPATDGRIPWARPAMAATCQRGAAHAMRADSQPSTCLYTDVLDRRPGCSGRPTCQSLSLLGLVERPKPSTIALARPWDALCRTARFTIPTTRCRPYHIQSICGFSRGNVRGRRGHAY